MYLRRYIWPGTNDDKQPPQKTPLFHHRGSGGKAPVRDGLKHLDAAQRQTFGATLLEASRPQLGWLLDPTRDVMLSTLQRAAALVGRKIQIELV